MIDSHASVSIPTAPGGSPLAGLDLVTIRNLRAWTLIGVHPHEREMRQELRIDAWLGTDTSRAAAGDDLQKAIDYSAVSRAFREHAGQAQHLLVETLAEDFAKIALERFGAQAVRISVEKPDAVPGTDAVGVLIERPR
ncbi:MAG: dihydroneopterin aldolase [Planctomycetota bacterium]|jgi:dihydroneopterin aldolase